LAVDNKRGDMYYLLILDWTGLPWLVLLKGE